MYNLFKGLTTVVQYKRKNDAGNWVTMAAFDIKGVAETYAKDCSSDNSPWDYRAVEIISNDVAEDSKEDDDGVIDVDDKA